MARGRSGVISKEYKGEDNTAYHDVIKLFKIFSIEKEIIIRHY